MANLKNITDLPVAESAEGLNLIVEQDGVAKRVAADAVGAKSWNDLKDKPFWTDDPVETVIFDGTVENDGYVSIALTVGQEYTVTFDGAEYVLTAQELDEEAFVGSESLFRGIEYVDSEPPFCLCNGWFYTVNEGDQYNLKVVGMISEVHQIDEKYIPAIGTKLTVHGNLDEGEVIPEVALFSSNSYASLPNNVVLFDADWQTVRLKGELFPYSGVALVVDTTTTLSLAVGDTKTHTITDADYLEAISKLYMSDTAFVYLTIVYKTNNLDAIISNAEKGVATGLSYGADGNLYGLNVAYTDTSATVTVKRLM